MATDMSRPQMGSFFLSVFLSFFLVKSCLSQRGYPDSAVEVESSESSESMRSDFAYESSHHNGLQHSDNTFWFTFSS